MTKPEIDAEGLAHDIKVSIAAYLELRDDAMGTVSDDTERNTSAEQVVDGIFSLVRCLAATRTSEAAEPVAFQQRVAPWMDACFGPEISGDRLERGDRFLEEALELLQSGNYPRERIAALTDYVFDRPQGEINQEVGGVMVTLAAYCLAFGLDMHAAGETELARIWTKVEKIRAKQAAKPTGSALPVAAPHPSPVSEEVTDEDVLKAAMAIKRVFYQRMDLGPEGDKELTLLDAAHLARAALASLRSAKP